MSTARRDPDVREDERALSSVDSRSEDRPAPTVLSRLSRRLPLLVACAALGAAVGGLFALLKTPSYRSTTTLLVAEPRGFGSQGSVDYLLTPIRSYTALVTSPALCEACAVAYNGGAAKPLSAALLKERLSVRMPENTRLLEVSFVSPEPRAGAAFLSCIAEKAVLENRRMNLDLADKAAAVVAKARDTAHAETTKLEAALAAQRTGTLLQLRHAELEAALSAIQAGSEEERRALVRLSEERARQKSYEESAKGRPVTRSLRTVSEDTTSVVREEGDPARELSEKGVAEARAGEAAARAMAEEGSRSKIAAATRAATLEKRLAQDEAAIDELRHHLESAREVEADLAKRQSATSLESASKAFELVTLAPASPPVSPTMPGPLASGAAGALASAILAALVVLSRPDAS